MIWNRSVKKAEGILHLPARGRVMAARDRITWLVGSLHLSPVRQARARACPAGVFISYGERSKAHLHLIVQKAAQWRVALSSCDAPFDFSETIGVL